MVLTETWSNLTEKPIKDVQENSPITELSIPDFVVKIDSN